MSLHAGQTEICQYWRCKYCKYHNDKKKLNIRISMSEKRSKHEGNTEVESNGYVVFFMKWVVMMEGKALLSPAPLFSTAGV